LKEVVFAPLTRAHTTKTPLLKLNKRCILIILTKIFWL
jgi:hypothetical protein